MINDAVPLKDRLVENSTIIIISFILIASMVFLMTDFNAIPALILALPVTFLLVSSTRLTAYLLIFSIYFSIRLIHSPSLLLCDSIALLFMASFAIDFLLKGKPCLKFPSIYKYYLALFIALVITTVFSINYMYSLTSFMRVIVQLVIVIILYNAFNPREAERLIKFYFWVAVGQSVYNLFLFFGSGGYTRFFGFAGPYFDDLTMLALPVGIACFIWSKSRREAFIYGAGSMIALMGMLATQSRAPLFTLAWVAVVMTVYSHFKAGKIGQSVVIKKLRFLFLVILVIGLVMALSGVLAGLVARFRELPEFYSGTVWLRMSLWRSSLMAFWENPLTGIGPGAFRHIESLYPILRFDAAMLYLDDASAHNLFLHYLAETGLIGTITLLALYFKNLLTSIKLVRFNKFDSQSAISVGLMGSGLVIFGSIFYMDGWMWGQNAYAAPLFIAITAKLANRKSQLEEIKK